MESARGAVCLVVLVGAKQLIAKHMTRGRNKSNFWTARVKSTKNDIFGILTSRAFDWYMYGNQRRGGGGGSQGGVRVFLFGGSPKLFWATSAGF